jgi:hypothetical protein
MRVSHWRFFALTLPIMFAALGLSPSTALARSADLRCKAPTTNFIVNEMRRTPDVQVFEFRGVDAKIGIQLYNALPPSGREQGDRFYILMRPGARMSQLLVGDSGCLRDGAFVDRSTARSIKKAIEKTAAKDTI